MNLRTYRFIAVVIHLAVYLPFFVVQLLYNFDIAGHASFTSSIKLSTQVSASRMQHAQGFGKNTGEQPVKAKIRLNKRFQPESIVAFNLYQTTPIIKWLTLFKPRLVNTELQSVLLSFNQPLRGPPSLVYIIS